VLEAEFRDVADALTARGVPTELLVFEDEGHDVRAQEQGCLLHADRGVLQKNT
jgi:dipeptidyl aminopeptidase/acylaminoacyl peptidase